MDHWKSTIVDGLAGVFIYKQTFTYRLYVFILLNRYLREELIDDIRKLANKFYHLICLIEIIMKKGELSGIRGVIIFYLFGNFWSSDYLCGSNEMKRGGGNVEI